jgi:Family of unknown function (DUF5906)/Primase C terminal 2 (PriCT-2)
MENGEIAYESEDGGYFIWHEQKFFRRYNHKDGEPLALCSGIVDASASSHGSVVVLHSLPGVEGERFFTWFSRKTQLNDWLKLLPKEQKYRVLTQEERKNPTIDGDVMPPLPPIPTAKLPDDFVLKPFGEPEPGEAKTKKEKQGKRPTTVEPDKGVKELLAMLSPDRAHDNTQWKEVGLALFYGGDCYYGPWFSWTKKHNKKWMDQCSTQWDQFEGEEEKFTLNSLFYWAKDDDPTSFRDWSDNKHTYDPYDEYYLDDYFREVQNVWFPHVSTMWGFVFSRLRRIVRVFELSTVFIKTKTDPYKRFKSTEIASVNNLRQYSYATDTSTKRVGILSLIFNSFFDVDMLHCIPYYRWQEDPVRAKYGNKVLNTFYGFPVSLVDRVDMELVEPCLSHIRVVLANNNEDLIRWIMSWFAAIIQHPHRKTSKSLLLYGDEGAGKSKFLQRMGKRIFGRRYCAKTSGMSKITQRFNSAIDCKVFVVVDEIGVQTLAAWNKVAETIKALVTESTLQVEKKFHETEEVKNFSNYAFTTNYNNCFKVDPKNRRYQIVEVNNCFIGDTGYFDRLYKPMKIPAVINHIFTFFYNYKEYDVDAVITKLVTTSIGELMKQTSYQDNVLFTKALQDGEFVMDTSCIDDKDGRICFVVPKLYEGYKAWHVANCIGLYKSLSEFAKDLCKLGVFVRNEGGTNNNRKKFGGVNRQIVFLGPNAGDLSFVEDQYVRTVAEVMTLRGLR